MKLANLSILFSLRSVTAIVLAAMSLVSQTQAQMGHVLESVGPVNQSMGGAATAMPADGSSAMEGGLHL